MNNQSRVLQRTLRRDILKDYESAVQRDREAVVSTSIQIRLRATGLDQVIVKTSLQKPSSIVSGPHLPSGVHDTGIHDIDTSPTLRVQIFETTLPNISY